MSKEFSNPSKFLTSRDFLKNRYLKPIKESSDLFIGIEFEFPIVHIKNFKTERAVSIGLLVFLQEKYGFQILKRDSEGHMIHLKDSSSGDEILFEVSYNTLEFAFGKARFIQEVDKRFSDYLKTVQSYLKKYDHMLLGKGINPNWAINDSHAVTIPRYKMLLEFLKMGNNYDRFHHYPEYASFICSSQVQFDVTQDNYLDVLNFFNMIEPVKAYLFPNSDFGEEYKDYQITRDLFWEDSMHGFYKENIGVYPSIFMTSKDYLDYLEQSSLFYIVRDGIYYYFEPIRICDYLEIGSVTAYDLEGQEVTLTPEVQDLDSHRSYHYQVLTTRGTVEFRSVCTQSFERSFVPAAFHLGLLEISRVLRLWYLQAFYQKIQIIVLKREDVIFHKKLSLKRLRLRFVLSVKI